MKEYIVKNKSFGFAVVGHQVFILHPDIHLILLIGVGKHIPSFKYWNVNRNTMRDMVQNDYLLYFYPPMVQRLMMLCFARREINWNHLPYCSMIKLGQSICWLMISQNPGAITPNQRMSPAIIAECIIWLGIYIKEIR